MTPKYRRAEEISAKIREKKREFIQTYGCPKNEKRINIMQKHVGKHYKRRLRGFRKMSSKYKRIYKIYKDQRDRDTYSHLGMSKGQQKLAGICQKYYK